VNLNLKQQPGLSQFDGPSYSSSKHPTVSYAEILGPPYLPTIHATRQGFSAGEDRMIECESASRQLKPTFDDEAPDKSSETSFFKPEEPVKAIFATEVDVLMMAIQAKQTTPPSEKEVATVSKQPIEHHLKLSSRQVDELKQPQRLRKQHRCHMPDCHKIQSQNKFERPHACTHW
jgi:hypothetical protein